ncbi:MAG: ABC transporter substrate-binding protein [Burkholderiaceae bacterium]|jgi:branched-chain amino acid transport system substrate-binding protein
MRATKFRGAALVVFTLGLGAASPALPQITQDTIRIGFITDLSGLYADIDGPAGVEAVKWAVEDMGGAINGKKIEILSADHLNKPDVAATKAREWFDQQGMSMLIGGTNSGTNLAMAKVAAEKKKLFIAVGGGTSALTNDQCTPYTIHYAYDTVALARGTGGAVTKSGGKTWFFLTADYAFGTALQNDTSAVVKANGGSVLGSVRHPLGASDFSSFLLQAQSSQAQILGLANAGGDTINSVKAANEFGITKTMKLAGLLMFINDVHSLGLPATQGMYLTDSWYWNQSPEARNWARRFFDHFKRMPSSIQAADYSATVQYLTAVKAANSTDTDKVMAELKKMTIHDMYTAHGTVRGDGTMVHDMYLMQVKTPAESKEPWDYYKVIETVKGDAAFTTKAETTCPLWK